MIAEAQVKAIIAGAALDTGNLGVSALAYATASRLTSESPPICVTVLDNGTGLRRHVLGPEYPDSVLLCGARLTRRWYLPESHFRIGIESRLGGLFNRSARHLLSADVYLDISGGDSFTDLYGPWRFNQICFGKQLILRHGIPLILLPQTYGPFNRLRNRRPAEYIVRNAAMAWARNPRSFDALRELLGNAFDPERHRCRVDVAFGLEVRTPQEHLLTAVQDWLSPRDTDRPIVGLNVSGLIYNDPAAARNQYQLKADYRSVIHELVRRLVTQANARVILIPHVVVPPPAVESDIGACQAVVAALREFSRDQLRVAPTFHDPREVKWLISQCDWFCGTRMHSTIAALSTGVPTAAIAYSLKTQGVFETCDQGDRVADPRHLDTADMVDHLWQSWLNRAQAKARLDAALPAVRHQAEQQMDEIVSFITNRAPAHA